MVETNTGHNRKREQKGIISFTTKILAIGRENVPAADVQNFRMGDFYLEFEEKFSSLLILNFINITYRDNFQLMTHIIAGGNLQ